MSGRKQRAVTFGWVLAVSFLASALTAMLISCYYNRITAELFSILHRAVLEQAPEAKGTLFAVWKEWETNDTDCVPVIWSAGAGLFAGILLFLFTFFRRNHIEAKRIQALVEYLEQAYVGKAPILSATGEDDFSRLEDEIYKTVTFLYQIKEAAVQAKDDFAENLANIAHQIKTPITAISLSVQAMQSEAQIIQSKAQTMQREDQTTQSMTQLMQKEGQTTQGEVSVMQEKAQTVQSEDKQERFEQIQGQLIRLTRLEEALLVLAKLDAGSLQLRKEEIDVFTVLILAADNLQELFAMSGTSLDIPELGGMAVTADLDWTMEAVMNLMKNCMEHNRGGTIHCSYEQNPLYTEILIWDEGEGFCKEDLPHLFERFYRGKHACEGGIGIGLSLAKEIIERQNGTIRAQNRQGGGACFEIRFYSH